MKYVMGVIAVLLAACGQQSNNLNVPDTDHARGVVTDMGSSSDAAYGVIAQADRKVIAVGQSNGKFAVARYSEKGVLDNKFNRSGKIVTTVGTSSVAKAVAVQTDGKIVVAGNSDSSFALVRYTSAGVLDSAFGTSGKKISIPGTAAALRLESSGKILVAGSYNNQFVIARHSASGALEQTASIALFDQDECRAMTLQADGKIILAGKTRGTTTIVTPQTTCEVCNEQCDIIDYDEFGDPIYNCYEVCVPAAPYLPGAVCETTYLEQQVTKSYIGVARLNQDLSLDLSFDADGILLAQYGGVDSEAYAVSLQDSKILIAGLVNGSDGSDFLVGRFYADGLLDTSFANTGWSKKTMGGADIAHAIQTLSDGRFIVIGASATNFVAARYTSAGLLDTTFGSNGIAKVSAGNARAGALDAYDRAIVAGESAGNFSVKRFTAAGTVDVF